MCCQTAAVSVGTTVFRPNVAHCSSTRTRGRSSLRVPLEQVVNRDQTTSTTWKSGLGGTAVECTCNSPRETVHDRLDIRQALVNTLELSLSWRCGVHTHSRESFPLLPLWGFNRWQWVGSAACRCSLRLLLLRSRTKVAMKWRLKLRLRRAINLLSLQSPYLAAAIRDQSSDDVVYVIATATCDPSS